MVDIPVTPEFILTTLVDIPPILLETICTDFTWNTESIYDVVIPITLLDVSKDVRGDPVAPIETLELNIVK